MTTEHDGEHYKRINAELELVAARASGKCGLGVSKAPQTFKDAAHEVCHIIARAEYLKEYLDCLADIDPGPCCETAYKAYCRAAEECDLC